MREKEVRLRERQFLLRGIAGRGRVEDAARRNPIEAASIEITVLPVGSIEYRDQVAARGFRLKNVDFIFEK